jgi:hypothetical protein
MQSAPTLREWQRTTRSGRSREFKHTDSFRGRAVIRAMTAPAIATVLPGVLRMVGQK